MNQHPHDPLPPLESNQRWQRWVQSRRSVEPSPEFTDRVMQAVNRPSAGEVSKNEVFKNDAFANEAGVQPAKNTKPELLDRISRSAWARFGVCSAAMLVGLLPFLYLAVTAKIIPF